MNVGIVAFWFNRGQGTVARHQRSALESLGHQTFVLARPAPRRFFRPGQVQSDDVWAEERVRPASDYEVPKDEYEDWARENDLQTVFFDQNYQFEEISTLRRAGIRTIGRFVWEAFGAQHVAGARAAFDEIYSLTACEHARYREMGIRSSRIHWGCHPELEPAPSSTGGEAIQVFYPGGYLSRRKPTGAVIEAFRRAGSSEARLIVKAQRPLRRSDLVIPKEQRDLARARNDPNDEEVAASSMEAEDERVRVIVDDLPLGEYYDLFRSADVCLAPSRWEGLGLHLYESVAFGLPLIVNDIPPLNEIVVHEENGLLVDSFQIGTARSGIPAWEPAVEGLTRAIESMTNPEQRERLRAGVARTREQLPWGRTVEEIGRLLTKVAE